MRQAVWMACGFFFLTLVLTGCGQRDPYKDVTNELLAKLDDAVGKYQSLKSKIDTVVKDKSKLEKKDLDEPKKAAREIGKLGKDISELKVELEGYKTLTQDEQTKYVQELTSEIETKMQGVAKIRYEVEVSLFRAEEKFGKDAIEPLREEYRQAEENIAVLSRKG
jgi:chaperonin cofactor prefoldin